MELDPIHRRTGFDLLGILRNILITNVVSNKPYAHLGGVYS
jgi:hypothetical protein